MKLLLLLTLFFAEEVFSCQWVCIDKKNNIKKHYFDKNKLKLEYSMPVIDIAAAARIDKKRNSALPEVTLRMPAFDVEPLEANCDNKGFTKVLKEINRKTKCSPRDTIVDLIYEGAKVVPNKVTTKLCTGVCSGSKTCLSVARRNISISVRTILNDGKVQCSTVLVPEDTKCRCDCDMSQSHCLESQAFDKKFCKCKCVNDREYFNCMNKIINHTPKKHWWNKNTCTCECLSEKVCTTGTIWNKNECKCVRMIS
ncbi:balbiani ring protein 3-like isoform X2 [Anoplophora glabripennis]|uniref:balbiani ring protein 3-like isoform X2 n=1 Tax=Anoplophora glabripennis TaxID=217634 RepID=UPI0008741901|nr:balbiani ring protein 3-like isoform X2 [Anoplophora glabripennis]